MHRPQRTPFVFVTIALAAGAGLASGQDLDQPFGVPGEVVKSLPSDIDRTASGLLPSPPPPPARPELNRAIEEADAQAIRQAWLRAQPAGVTFLTPEADQELVEGDGFGVTWETSGPITHVRLSYRANRCPVGGRDRGLLEGQIAARAENAGRLTWRVPWLDALSVTLRVAALGDDGTKLAASERLVRFRPRCMADLRDKGTLIAISKTRQRLYLQKDGRLIREHLVSTAADGHWTPLMKPGSAGGDGETGQVFNKSLNAWSSRYHVWMPYWMAITSSGSHGIHATSPRFYDLLGSPASHGCVRQHHADARILYGLVEVGTPVYVFP